MLCEHPVILLDPDFKYLAPKYGHIYINDKCVYVGANYRVPEIRKFLPKRNGITPENYQHSYFLNPETGDTHPLYICVPCGKCILCKDKKVKELAARCVAETNLHGRVPYFITMTYAPKYLPEEGLRKKDVQLFLKRLRRLLDLSNIQHSLRYLVVGEYGSKRGRAHYHLILWNFPDTDVHFPNIVSVQRFIQRAWSVYVLDERGKRIPLRDPSSGSIIPGRFKTDPIGSIKVLPMKEGCPAYVLKYMKKQSVHSIGRTPTFQCASNRGGGIGSAFIRSQSDFFRKNPNLQAFNLVDKVVSGKIIKMPITSYVKSILYPSVSKAFKRREYDILRDFYTDLELIDGLLLRARELYNLDEFVFDKYGRKIITKSWPEPFFEWFNNEDYKKCVEKTSYFHRCFHNQFHTDLDFGFIKDRDTLWEHWYVLTDELQSLTKKILAMPDMRSYFCARERFLKTRHDIMESMFGNSEDLNIQYCAEIARKRVEDSIYKETF